MTPLIFIGINFRTEIGQHILKNPLIVASMVEKVGETGHVWPHLWSTQQLKEHDHRVQPVCRQVLEMESCPEVTSFCIINEIIPIALSILVGVSEAFAVGIA